VERKVASGSPATTVEKRVASGAPATTVGKKVGVLVFQVQKIACTD
jgi:hypothetical protein